MHCVAVVEPAGADALAGAIAAPLEPSIVAVVISPATSATTVLARLSAWTCDKTGVAGAVPPSLLHAVTPRATTAAVPSASSGVRVRMSLSSVGSGKRSGANRCCLRFGTLGVTALLSLLDGFATHGR